MTRQQLEHIIRAAAATADARDIVVIGSQSILGAYPNPPLELTKSMEADVFPKESPQRSIIIDGAIGELSLFHETFGYHAHGVDDTTAMLPAGWQERLIKVETPGTMGAIGWCLEPHDLAVAKLAAGREKDLAFVQTMVREKLVSVDVIRERLSLTPNVPPQVHDLAMARLNGWDETQA
jgi:hypothetical protein